MADFYLDHNVAMSVAPELRSRGHTARTAHDMGLASAKDDEQILVAAQNGWTLITHNRKDFALLHDAWQRWTRTWQVHERHAGILLVPQTWVAGEIAREIELFVQTAQPLMNQLYEWRPSSGWVRR